MSAQLAIPFTAASIQRRRDGKRAQIEAFFGDNLGLKFTSEFCHTRWGSAFRSRVSDINRDEFSGLTIKNETDINDHSVYWSEVK